MKTNHLLPIAALGLLGLGTSVFAQSGTVTNAADSSNEAVPAQETAAMPAPNQIVYRATLPSAQELTNAAAAQGLTVEQISQTANQVVAVYKTKSGQSMAVAYALLPSAGGSASVQAEVTTAPVQYVPSTAVVATAPATTTVVYTDPYAYDPVYSPWYYGYGWGYPGIAVGIGLGGYWSHGHYYHGGYYHGGYYHGGYHGGGHPGGGHPVGSHTAGGFHTGGGFHH